MTVTYGDRLALCEETVSRALAGGASHVIIVDNGSTNKLSGSLAARYSSSESVTVVTHERNLGSAGGFAAGMSAALLREENFILLLDDDNLIGETTIATALEFQAHAADHLQDPLSIVACNRAANSLHARIAGGAAASDVYPPAGSFVSFDLPQRVLGWVGRLSPSAARSRAASAFPSIPHGPYGGLLLPAEVIRRHGTPDDRLVLYEDDTAWTSSLVAGGRQILLCIAAVVIDAEGKWHDEASGKRGPRRMLGSKNRVRLYYSVRNRVLFDRSRVAGATVLTRYTINKLIFVSYALASRASPSFRSSRKTFRRAIRDGERGNLGVGPTLSETNA